MCLFLLSSESIDNGVCFTEGSFLPLWLWISFTSTLSIPSLSTSFSVLFNPSSSPPFSCSSHSRSHTGDAWIGGSPDQCCRSPSSAEGRAQTQSNPDQKILKISAILWEGEALERGFLAADGHLSKVLKTGTVSFYNQRGMVRMKAVCWLFWGMQSFKLGFCV